MADCQVGNDTVLQHEFAFSLGTVPVSSQIWTLNDTRHGFLIIGVPATELLFAFAAGFYSSILFVYRV